MMRSSQRSASSRRSANSSAHTGQWISRKPSTVVRSAARSVRSASATTSAAVAPAAGAAYAAKPSRSSSAADCPWPAIAIASLSCPAVMLEEWKSTCSRDMQGNERLSLRRARLRLGAGQPGDGRAKDGLSLLGAILVDIAVGKLPGSRCPGAGVFAEPQRVLQMLDSAHVVSQGFGPSELDEDFRPDAGRGRLGDGPAQVGRPGLWAELRGGRRTEDPDSPCVAR